MTIDPNQIKKKYLHKQQKKQISIYQNQTGQIMPCRKLSVASKINLEVSIKAEHNNAMILHIYTSTHIHSIYYEAG